MYEFKPVTARIDNMKQYVRDRELQIDTERAKIVTEFYKNNSKMPPMVKMAAATYEVCSKVTCRVEDDELLAVNTGKNFLGCGMWPDWDGAWLWRELRDGKYWTRHDNGKWYRENHGMQFIISDEDREYYLSIADYWSENSVTSNVDHWAPDGFEEVEDLNVLYGCMGAPRADIPSGHLVAGYEKILKVGYRAIRQQAQEWIDAHKGNLMGEDVEKFFFYKSAVFVCDAASIMIRHYAEEAYRKAEVCTDPIRKSELLTMADGLEWISENPVRTFWEALQATLMYQLLLYMEARHPALAFGRVDQYTWPYLKADLAAGYITEEFAQELVDTFFLKSSCMFRATDPVLAQTIGVGNTSHHTTLGGVDPDTGEDAANPVTYMCLESMCRLALHDPQISLRINKNTPDKLWDLAVETTKRIGGLPLFQNDEVIIPATMEEMGFSLHDARDYAIIGCQEIVGSGNDMSCGNGIHAKAGVSSHANVLLLAINNGTNPLTGKSGALKTGYLYDMKSFEEVKAAYEKQFRFLHRWAVTMQNYVEFVTRELAPHAALSISIDDCMQKGQDCIRGGARYNSFGGTGTGLATPADSLTTIRYAVFDKKLCSAQELYDAIMANWEGHEVLRQKLLKEVPHYGNGDAYADEMMKWVCDIYYDECKQSYSTRTPIYKAGLYGAANHVVHGSYSGATPDGRKAGEPLADAMSPAQGRDKNGPLAILNSARCHEQNRFMDGIAVNIKVHPSALNGEDGAIKLRDMTKSYFEDGGMEIQYNVVSSDVLRKAQTDPGSYRNLVVRIAGYSAYFVEMSPELQNDIIKRNENGL
jgi:formate C-acetyltransferase